MPGGRPKGAANKTPRPVKKQTYICALPGCGVTIEVWPSERPSNAYCCQHHAALARERALGHEPPIEKPCTCGCGQMVKRYVSRSSRVYTGNVFVNRGHYLKWRHNYYAQAPHTDG